MRSTRRARSSPSPPEGASDGVIAVTTPTGTGTSETNFPVGGAVAHLSKVTLKLSEHLVASGTVSSVDGTASCVDGRTVVIQRRVSGMWTNRGQDQTDETGSYRKKIKNKKGLYRALVTKATLPNGEGMLARPLEQETRFLTLASSSGGGGDPATFSLTSAASPTDG